VEILLEAGAHPDGGPDWITDSIGGKYGDEFQSPLSTAARNGHTEIMRLLLSRGAHIDLAEGEGQTPLVSAISAKQKAAVALLLASGADPNSPFVEHYLARSDDPELIAMVMDAKANKRLTKR